jgi:F0F1-type ATP synthase membrane subunit b/b'
MGSKRAYTAQAVGAKRNWTDREWQIYENLPWIMQKFVDILILIPRFAPQPAIGKIDRRSRFVERKLLEAKRQAGHRG